MDDTSAAEDWEQVQALFPAQNSITSKSWTFGFSGRLPRTRIDRLMQTQAAAKLALMLDQRSNMRIKALRTFAAVNLEQATAAFRISIIANVSVPILLLTVINLLFPGSLGRIFLSTFEVSQQFLMIQLGVMFLTLSWLLAVLIYAVACLNQARDIRHLIDLTAAERGIYFGLEDIVEMQSD
jgi:hypothetical protein